MEKGFKCQAGSSGIYVVGTREPLKACEQRNELGNWEGGNLISV